MIPVPTREEQFAFQALQKAVAEEKIIVRINFKRLNRYTSPFFNPWENILPLLAIIFVSFGLMFTDNLVVGMAVLVLLVFLYVILMPFILTPVMHARVVKRIVPRMERFLVAWRYGGIALVLSADTDIACKSPTGNWQAFIEDYFSDLIPPDAAEKSNEAR